jgi:serine/threonine protein phosphatase PrpC
LELTPKYLQVNAVSKSAAREFANTKYQTGTIDFQPGDILAIVTDGLTEVFDLHDRELGDATSKARSSSRPHRKHFPIRKNPRQSHRRSNFAPRPPPSVDSY